MGKQRPPARLRGGKWGNSQGRPFLLLWGSVCCYYAPPSAFHLWNSRTHHGKHHSPLSAGGIYSGAVHVRNLPPVLSGGQSLPAHEKTSPPPFRFYTLAPFTPGSGTSHPPHQHGSLPPHGHDGSTLCRNVPENAGNKPVARPPVRLRHSLLGQAPSLLLGKRCHHETRRR